MNRRPYHYGSYAGGGKRFTPLPVKRTTQIQIEVVEACLSRARETGATSLVSSWERELELLQEQLRKEEGAEMGYGG